MKKYLQKCNLYIDISQICDYNTIKIALMRMKGGNILNLFKLRRKIMESGKSISEIAKELGISASTFYRKLANKGEPITIKEANCLVEILSIEPEEAADIFFDHNVA